MNHNLDFIDKSNLTWLKSNTIFLTVVGSQSYGLATSESDIDYKGLAIPPKDYYIGFAKKFEQAEFRTPNPDCCIFNLVKWIALACDNNPSVIEILWTDPEFYVISSPYWDSIVDNRDKFLSKNVRWRFAGYGIQQLRKLQRHYKYLRNPPKQPPTRADFDLPEYFVLPKDQLQAAEALIQKRLDCWNPKWEGVDESKRIELMNEITNILVEVAGASLYLEKEKLWKTAAINIGMDINFIELINSEKRYKAAKEEWRHYMEWKEHRNTKRAAIEAKVGYDGKDAAALVRLMRMAKEILTTGKVIVKRPDREELLAIKNGLWSYEQVIEFAENADKELNSLYESSPLPYSPNREYIQDLCVGIVDDFHRCNNFR
jgi:hypothetical protein